MSTLTSAIETVKKTTKSTVQSSLSSDIGTPQPLHISLSAPLVLRTEKRDEFLAAVRDEVNAALGIDPAEKIEQRDSKSLKLRLGPLKWAANHERNRWFLAAGIERPEGNELNHLLNACNEVAAHRGLPMLYAKRKAAKKSNAASEAGFESPGTEPDYSERFHFSIGWTLDSPTTKDSVTVPVKLSGSETERMKDVEVTIRSVKVKIGSNITSIPLIQQKT